MAYTKAQRHVLGAIRKEALRRYSKGGFSKAERRKIKSAFLTGRVESNFTNLGGGDADSAGWRQERASLYANPTNLKASTKRYFNEADQLYSGGTAASLAGRVQRPAAQYLSRYGEHSAEGRKLTKKVVRGRAVSGPNGTTRVNTRRVVTPGVDRSGDRRALLLDYLEQRDNPEALLNVAKTLPGLKDTPRSVKTTRAKTSQEGVPGKAEGEQVGTLKTLIERASHMNAKHMPYVWGGGHGSPKAVGPWDCSGAISRLFRINPRVSGQFASWGKPGKGKHVTVYANSGHVFAEIDGRFFGTSRSNPGGGAGWIPASQMSASYLAGFTKRHPEGL